MAGTPPAAPPYHLGMQFSRELRERVAAGEITVSVRLWSRPQVRVGGTYPVLGATIEIDDIELLPFAEISDDDVLSAGEFTREAQRARAAHAGPITDETLVYRVQFHVVR